ncbi:MULTISPECIES: hypothetical protein [Campylobacter]|uniref:Uncharacterized protein n=1 Tax=Campylobacter porcelli TaxID=1660073 RepID=A0A1X9SUW3_9BACT|nr:MULTISPECIES: hypothetical protein [unclassified Campylobacter]MCR8678881.1 hypothetical protein [Campylobacter sp. RM19072]MEE3704818.1 hypothetical protein [Campylobacter sp. CX2-8023-23]MEE3744096.1 hypothetical protein [Campylobacter sp. CX2-4855-23]MEE3776841.1 hypothetical protein [Campylobacter sp. CX2-4080-23]ARR00050.1 hypothetical protein CSUIS_0203 [Campylobacter sp. RM6137]
MVRMTMLQHACVPKELHQTYDLLKILEKQEEGKKDNKDDKIKVELSSSTINQTTINSDNKLDILA